MSDPMTDLGRRALLPAGLRDVLPPNAENEARLIEVMVARTATHGYERVKPPLIEFETSLLEGPGAALSSRVFRLMDPMSQRMMGVRADMTAQVARIASTRLKNVPRPLRLCYAGEVLHTTAEQVSPEREMVQVGAELIGSHTAAADAEIILVGIEALRAAGIERLSLDLMVPPLVPAVLAGLDLPAAEAARLRAAIDRKDTAAVEELGGKVAPVLTRLLAATGPKDNALAALAGIDLPEEARAALDRLTEVADLVAAAAPGLAITLDPVENRGFEYHTGIAFSLFVRGVRAEVGRGGRYRPNGDPNETATGFTLYMEKVLQALPAPKRREAVFVPHGAPREAAAALRAEGRVTVQGLEPVADVVAEARRQRCAAVWQDGKVIALGKAGASEDKA
ncbi:ATP phosphoribosyltransferase regulatory subunit [Thalassobaculum fulvum]|uniref:ATP phosphoribosyltransferase regulatory subunit n=1 Tax=Thalassobaculum fulvum TaxID=1633335 RepID=A0A918XTH1_9PROT|nr:ATP phosphoribosyltransferase regulatory subunit [Thalassobaculum fulvum]GHD54291.1 ATP phosphoribosyltransferase regulatory subunit [Thalassobaculum fulvum]